MKENFIHICMVIDESGSMSGKENDVVGGFKSVIDEQKANTEGTCSVSYFKFSDGVEEVYRGVDVRDVEPIEGKYHPHGLTALFDGVGIAIDRIGEWLASMDESERPEKNLVVIMTDGGLFPCSCSRGSRARPRRSRRASPSRRRSSHRPASTRCGWRGTRMVRARSSRARR